MMGLIISSLCAGVSIAIGCFLFLLTENKIIGSALFACGLLNIRTANLHLFTGQTQNLYYKKISVLDLWGVLCLNGFGALITGLLMSACYPTLGPKAQVIVNRVAAMPIDEILIRAVVCGFLMTLACRADSPLWVSVLCVMGFILSGSLHSIALFGYYGLSSSGSGAALGLVILGNFIGGSIGAVKRG